MLAFLIISYPALLKSNGYFIRGFGDATNRVITQGIAALEYRFFKAITNSQNPTANQEELVEEAKKKLNFNESIKIASGWPYSTIMPLSGIPFMVVCDSNKQEEQLWPVYHEMGHIVHQDSVKRRSLGLWRRLVGLSVKNRLENVTEKAEFRTDYAVIQGYIEVGKKAFDETTDIGQLVHQVFCEHDSLWIEPHDRENYLLACISRQQEFYADLFAVEKLLEYHEHAIILQDVRAKLTSKFVVAQDISMPGMYQRADHPSDFERGLAIIGFLVNKRVDINALYETNL